VITCDVVPPQREQLPRPYTGVAGEQHHRAVLGRKVAKLHPLVNREVGERLQIGFRQRDEVLAPTGLRQAQVAERVLRHQSVAHCVAEHRPHGRHVAWMLERPCAGRWTIYVGQLDAGEVLRKPSGVLTVECPRFCGQGWLGQFLFCLDLD
jgi:hypothetical protein